MIALHYGLWRQFPRWTTTLDASFVMYSVVCFPHVLHVLHLVRNPARNILQPCQSLDFPTFVQKPTVSTSAKVVDSMLTKLPRVRGSVTCYYHWQGWGERPLKSENCLRPTDHETQEEIEKYPIIPLQQSGLVCNKTWPQFIHRLTWHGMLQDWACAHNYRSMHVPFLEQAICW